MTAFNRVKFWQDPEGSGQSPKMARTGRPEHYLEQSNVTAIWLDVMARYAQPTNRILEIGSGTGRNLVAIQNAGFKDVHGVEISKRTIEVGRSRFAEYKDIDVINAPIEECVKELEDADIIFTSGLLMHLPHDIKWVFGVIAAKAKRVIAICEDEQSNAINAWPRNYQDVFEALGWKQVEEEHCDKYPPLPYSTIKRVFIRE